MEPEWAQGFLIRGLGYVAPWPCLIMATYSFRGLVRAIEEIVSGCYSEADGDRTRFMKNMSTFVHWNGWEPLYPRTIGGFTPLGPSG